MYWLYLFLAISSEVLGTSFLKLSNGFSVLYPSLIAVCCFLFSFYFLSLTLKYVPVGIIYAIWSGAGIFFISLIGVIFFKQSLDIAALIGMSLIILGVIIIYTLSDSLRIN